MQTKYLIYEILKNSGKKLNAYEVGLKIKNLTPYVENMMIKLARDYPRIKVENKKGINYFWYEGEDED